MSSFVFVVILAVWAVYLVQHWVRRRDHLATARSVDRFSEAMRVLERRRTLPVPEVDAHPRSYAASPLRPARPGRPEVVVKRAGHGATAVAPSADYRRSRTVARLRGLALLTGSLAMVTLVALSVAEVLAPWYALVGVGAAVLAVGLVRWSVSSGAGAAARRAAPASRPTVRAAGSRTVRPAARPASRRKVGGDARPTAGPTVRHHHPAAETPERLAPERLAPETVGAEHAGHEFSAQSVAATLRTAPRRDRAREVAAEAVEGPELYDVVEVEAALAPRDEVAPEPAPVVQPTDGTWNPVPVPTPTYNLKAKAYHVPARLTGSAELPADGTEMALDEEFEDLPRIDRAV